MRSNGSTGPAIPRLSGTLADAYRAPGDPLDGAPPSPETIYRDIPSTVVTEWTPPMMRSALADHMVGQFAGSARLTDATYCDSRIQAAMGTRVDALLGKPVRFTPANNSRAAREVCDAWQDNYERIMPRAEATAILSWAIMMGFVPVELLWDTTGEVWVPTPKWWHPEFVWYNVISRRYVAATLDGQLELEPGNGKWMLHAPWGEYRGWVRGAIRALASPFLARQYAAYRDWPRYCEIHGIPIIKGIVPFAYDEEQKRRFHSSVSQLGSETAIMCPQDAKEGRKFDVELLEAQDSTWQAFPGLVTMADTSIVLILQGQNLTTEIKEGSFAAAREHGDVRQDMLESDDMRFGQSQLQIARPFAAYNFGDANLAPRTWRIVQPAEDLATTARAYSDLATAVRTLTEVGAPINFKKLARRFRLPLAEEMQLEAPDVSAPAPAPPEDNADAE